MTVVSFLARRGPRSSDWSQQELASLYRAHDFLNRQGLGVGLEKGLTDLGEPWCVFYDHGSEEVMAHFARNGGRYLIACPFVDKPSWGNTLDEAIEAFYGAIDGYLGQVRARSGGGKVVMHPATRLVFSLSTLFFLLQLDQRSAQATEPGNEGEAEATGSGMLDTLLPRMAKSIDIDNQYLLVAAAIGLFFASKSSFISMDGDDVIGALLNVEGREGTSDYASLSTWQAPLQDHDVAFVEGESGTGEHYAPDLSLFEPAVYALHDITADSWFEIEQVHPSDGFEMAEVQSGQGGAAYSMMADVDALANASLVVDQAGASEILSDAARFIITNLADFTIARNAVPEEVIDVISEIQAPHPDFDNNIELTLTHLSTNLVGFLSEFINVNFENSHFVYQADRGSYYLIDTGMTADDITNYEYYVVSLAFSDNTVINLVGLGTLESATMPEYGWLT